MRVCVLACVHSWEVGGEYTESDARPLRLDRINHVNDRGTPLAGGLLVGGGRYLATCADVQSDFMDFVRSSLSNLNEKLHVDAFVVKQLRQAVQSDA